MSGREKCDLVAMARNHMADTEYVNKNRDGEFDEVRPCIRCNNCCTAPQGLPIRCAVNPVLGREVEYARTPIRKPFRSITRGRAASSRFFPAPVKGICPPNWLTLD